MANNSLRRIQRQFPAVTTVIDSLKPILVTVTSRDNANAQPGDPNNCALARACKRQEHADGVIIGLSISWVIKDDIAWRYQTSHGVARELVSFDRHHDFAPGRNYRLAAVSPRRRLGVHPGGKKKDRSGNGKKLKHVTHRTVGVRKI